MFLLKVRTCSIATDRNPTQTEIKRMYWFLSLNDIVVDLTSSTTRPRWYLQDSHSLYLSDVFILYDSSLRVSPGITCQDGSTFLLPSWYFSNFSMNQNHLERVC